MSEEVAEVTSRNKSVLDRELQQKRERFQQEAFPLMPMLYRTALRLTRNQHDAEDLVQNAVLRAYTFFDKFQPGTSFKAWVFKIMTNVFINDYHKRVRAPLTVPLENQSGFEPDPEKLFFDQVMDTDIKKAVEELPEVYRLTFLLASEGFSYKEIASITRANLGTVMSRLYRARRLLQGKLWEYAKGVER
jgi:RNA polymerase sigma-70 factor (ECF subfamily)